MTSLPYNGSSGWSGTQTSKERAEEADSSGTTSKRQREVLAVVDVHGAYGVTVKDLRESLPLHHGQASGALSNLHKDGRIARLAETRDRCKVYVLPEHVGGREVEASGDRGDLQRRIAEHRQHCTANTCCIEQVFG